MASNMASNMVQKKIILIIEDEDEDKRIQEKETYYQCNKDMFKERYLNNLEKNRSYQVYYNLANHGKYCEYQKSYYEKRKEELLEMKKEKVLCECGKIVSVGHLTCHKKSNIHLKRMTK
jgi:hypothetical protein